VRAWTARDARIRLVRHATTAGAAIARNTGIAAATGDWLAFMDSDDEYLPGALAVFARAIAADPSARVVCGGLSGTRRTDPACRMDGRIAAFDAFDAMLGFAITAHPRVQVIALAVHRTVIDECGGFSTAPEFARSSEDREWLVRVTARHRVTFVRTFVAHYHEGQGASDRSLADGTKLVALRRLLATMPSTAPDHVRLRDAHLAILDAAAALRTDEIAAAKRHLGDALSRCRSAAERRAAIVRLVYLVTYPAARPWAAAARSARWLHALGLHTAALAIRAWTLLVIMRSSRSVRPR
jgi:glycosyltransferase involved in cell wall biosynthesis